MNLIDSIYSNPQDWRTGEHYFIHKAGAKLWISNGIFYCEPAGGKFDLLTKWRAWRAFRWWCVNAPVEAYGRK